MMRGTRASLSGSRLNILSFLTFDCSIWKHSVKEWRMYSSENCRTQLDECRNLYPSAKSTAEATVLKNLIRSWKMIANQMALYEAILKDQK